MKKMVLVKSSFTLPPAEVSLVTRLKRQLHLASNTAVVRRALSDLEKKIEREELRRQFRAAVQVVRPSSEEEIHEMDHLVNEGLGDS